MLLATKLHAPQTRHDHVARPHLLEKLNTGFPGKLSLLSAPAGYGKTTLVSQWIAQLGHRTAWLTLDEADSDPARFLDYFVAAIQSILPQFGEGLLALPA